MFDAKNSRKRRAARSAAAAINADNLVVIGAIWFITMGRAAVTCETMEHASRRCYASPPRGRLPPIFSSRRQAEAVVRRRWPDRYVPGSSPVGSTRKPLPLCCGGIPRGCVHSRSHGNVKERAHARAVAGIAVLISPPRLIRSPASSSRPMVIGPDVRCIWERPRRIRAHNERNDLHATPHSARHGLFGSLWLQRLGPR